jgi:sigma-B regulation protein RsbU (phosphoserine phosphatase)
MDILIAEDDCSARLLLSTYLKKWGHRVIETTNGREAWQYLQSHPVHFVISDWLMPHLDGLELCRRIRENNFPHYIYTILLTAKNDKDEITRGIESGADDFVTKPFNANEFNARIRAGQRILDLERKLEDRNHALSRANAVIRKDLEAAAELQESLLPEPSQTINGLYFESLFLPCAFVAGDIFNFFRLDDHRVGFYQLDVAGHGIPAAMLSITLSKILATPNFGYDGSKNNREITDGQSPAKRITDLNRQFYSTEISMRHFTMVYGEVDTRSNKIKISQAGHPSPILMNQSGAKLAPVIGGFPVGLQLDIEYEESEFDFNPGDRLIIYSDGVTECLNPHEQQYSLSRLTRRLRRIRHLPLAEVLRRLKSSLNSWRGGDQFDDDISVLAIERMA